MVKQMITIVGIDYSMSSPAITIFSGNLESFCYSNCQCFFLTSNKKFVGKFQPNIIGTEMPFWNSEEERFDHISSWALSCLPDKVDLIGIEGYSFGSKGRVFNIAENCGLLKHKLWKLKIPIEIVAPSAIKKHGAGKGNAKKEVLEEHFLAKTGLDLRTILGQTQKQMNPSSDIIDSYFLTGYLATQAQRAD